MVGMQQILARRRQKQARLEAQANSQVRQLKNATGLSGRLFKKFRCWARRNAPLNVMEADVPGLVDDWYRSRGFVVK